MNQQLFEPAAVRPPVDFQQSKPYLDSVITSFEIARCSGEVLRDC
jgi:hypothetical protein